MGGMGLSSLRCFYVNPFRHLFPNSALSAELNHCDRDTNSKNNSNNKNQNPYWRKNINTLSSLCEEHFSYLERLVLFYMKNFFFEFIAVQEVSVSFFESILKIKGEDKIHYS